jgi:aminoglycoside 2'-N-acetyltransferase I
MSEQADSDSLLSLSVLPTVALTPAARDAIVALCSRAFEQDFSTLFVFVQGADHVLATRGGRLVGHALWGTRWLQPEGLEPLRTAYVDAVATAPELWGTGIGRAVMGCLERETSEFDIRALSTDVPGFYDRLGWQRWNGPMGGRKDGEIVATPDEVVMVSCTARTPALDCEGAVSIEWRDGSVW